MHPWRGGRLPNECPWHDTKQSDAEASGMQSTPSLPSLPNPLWLGVVELCRALSMGQIEWFDI